MITQMNLVPMVPKRAMQTPVVVSAAPPMDLARLSPAAVTGSKGRDAAGVAGGILGGAALGVAGAYAGAEGGLLVGLLLPADSLTSLFVHTFNGAMVGEAVGAVALGAAGVWLGSQGARALYDKIKH